MPDPTERFDENRAAAGVRDVTSDPEPALRADAQLQRDAQLRELVAELGAELGDAPVLHLSADPAALAADGGGDDPDAAAHELDDDDDPAATDRTTAEALALRDGPPRPAAIGNRRPPALRQRLDSGAVEARTHDPRDPS